MNVGTDPTKRRWLAFVALATVFLLATLHRLSTAVLSGHLTDAFGIVAAAVGLGFCCPLWLLVRDRRRGRPRDDG